MAEEKKGRIYNAYTALMSRVEDVETWINTFDMALNNQKVLKGLLYHFATKDINWSYKDEKKGMKKDMHKLINELLKSKKVKLVDSEPKQMRPMTVPSESIYNDLLPRMTRQGFMVDLPKSKEHECRWGNNVVHGNVCLDCGWKQKDGKKRFNTVGTGGSTSTRHVECELMAINFKPVLLGDSSDDLTPSEPSAPLGCKMCSYDFVEDCSEGCREIINSEEEAGRDTKQAYNLGYGDAMAKTNIDIFETSKTHKLVEIKHLKEWNKGFGLYKLDKYLG